MKNLSLKQIVNYLKILYKLYCIFSSILIQAFFSIFILFLIFFVLKYDWSISFHEKLSSAQEALEVLLSINYFFSCTFLGHFQIELIFTFTVCLKISKRPKIFSKFQHEHFCICPRAKACLSLFSSFSPSKPRKNAKSPPVRFFFELMMMMIS